MNRITEIELAGTSYPLNFSTRAAELFDERYGGLENIGSAISGSTTGKTIKEVRWMLATLIGQGAAYRRIVDKVENPPCLTEEELAVVMGIQDIQKLKTTLLAAMSAGSEPTVEVEPDKKNADATQGE